MENESSMRNEKYKVGVVVLNYCTENFTCKCVDSFIEKADVKINVIVVDNGSADGSGERLDQRYKDKDGVFVILNGVNLGFSKGMNVGFNYAKNVLGCNFIILSNSDITMNSENYCNRLFDDYYKYKFAVLGPLIERLDGLGDEVNPYLYEKLSPLKKYKITKKKLFLRRIKLYFACFMTVS